MPSHETNCIEEWQTKVEAITQETIKEDMTLISGITSWVQMYYEELLAKSGKRSIQEVFPNFSLFVYARSGSGQLLGAATISARHINDTRRGRGTHTVFAVAEMERWVLEV